jgi:hypothetical protein
MGYEHKRRTKKKVCIVPFSIVDSLGGDIVFKAAVFQDESRRVNILILSYELKKMKPQSANVVIIINPCLELAQNIYKILHIS